MDQFSTVNDTDALAAWVAKQALRSANAMERAISATALVRRRDAFGQVVVPTDGSVLDSPVLADWDPEPDYLFHWVRDERKNVGEGKNGSVRVDYVGSRI